MKDRNLTLNMEQGLASVIQKLQSLNRSLKISLWLADTVGQVGFKPCLTVNRGTKQQISVYLPLAF